MKSFFLRVDSSFLENGNEIMRSRSWKQGLEMPTSALREKTYEEEYVQVLQALLEFAPGGIFSYSAEADEQFSFISKNMV